MPKWLINLEEIVLRGHGNFEEQNKVLDYAIIIINYYVIVIISAYCIILYYYHHHHHHYHVHEGLGVFTVP